MKLLALPSARALAIGAALLLSMVGPLPVTAQDAVPQTAEQIRLTFAPLVRAASPAVVSVYTTALVGGMPDSPLWDDPFFRHFFGDRLPPSYQQPPEEQMAGLGSGVIVRPEGVVVTNNHVVAGAHRILVILSDRREFEAELVGTDEATDLAVLRIAVDPDDAEDYGVLPSLTLANSDTLEVGDLVLAIGNPFGVGQTVTSGIISALARTRVGVTDYSFFIQTDAAINPGNSGGALITLDGELAGINTAIFSQSGGSIGVGFAIPANMVATVVDGILEQGRVIRPWLGVVMQDVTPDKAEALGMARPYGGLIADVAPDSPAAEAGLERGDVIVAVGGQEVGDSDAIRFRVGTFPPGQEIAVTIWRDGEEYVLPAILEPPPSAMAETTAVTLRGRNPFDGAVVADLSAGLIYERGLQEVESGALVLRIEPGSYAAQLGLQPDDVVIEVNGAAIDTAARLETALQTRTGQWQITINRGGEVLTVSLQL